MTLNATHLCHHHLALHDQHLHDQHLRGPLYHHHQILNKTIKNL